MVFNSLAFAVFLPVVLAVYYVLSHRAQNLWLLGASVLFYAWWDPRFLLLLGVTMSVDFVASNRIHEASDLSTKRRWLLTSMLANLGVLGFFKYFNFFVDSAEAMIGALGIPIQPWTLRVVLPVGISFYTFQEMAYTIDVYRGHLKPAKRFLDFALFVAYFPQLVAGPIERATHLLPQIEQKRSVSGEQIRGGLALIFIGLFKKVAIADAMAPVVDLHFSQPESFAWHSLLLSLYMFAIQIYCDFSGYTDVARGCSKLLGVELMLNFRQPYLSTSITEFWRRWHISLSSWLRDYLYIPLGGNRHGVVKTYRNLMLTMLLGGLWHGASWTFVVWGGLHGIYLAVHKWSIDRFSRSDWQSGPLLAFVSGLATFHLVCLTWIFFRAKDISLAGSFLSRILRGEGGDFFFGNFDLARFGVLAGSLLLLDVTTAFVPAFRVTWMSHWGVRGLGYGTALLVWFALGGVDAQVPFIYFQF